MCRRNRRRWLEGRDARSCPRTRTSPASGGSSPVSTRSSVVLPAPDGPSSATTCPRGTTRSRAFRTGRPPKDRVNPRSSTAAGWPVTPVACSTGEVDLLDNSTDAVPHLGLRRHVALRLLDVQYGLVLRPRGVQGQEGVDDLLTGPRPAARVHVVPHHPGVVHEVGGGPDHLHPRGIHFLLRYHPVEGLVV